jgi:copper transport protein
VSNGAAALFASTTLEEFLDRSDGNATAERLQRIGLGMGAVGILLATGVIALVLLAGLGRTDRDVLFRVVVLGGLVAAFGSVIEVVGIADALEVGWWDAFRDDSGAAPMMRLLGSLLVVFGLVDQLIGDEAAPEPTARGSIPLFALGGVVVGLLSFAFDGHSNSEGPRVVHALVDQVHVAAAGIWFGGVVALVVLAARGSVASIAGVAQRFASLAAGALVAVTAAGIAMAVFILDDVDDVTGTTWGRLLIAKTVLVAVIAAIGTYHHVTIARPGSPPRDGGDRVVVTTLAVEAVLFVAVLAITAVLVTTSPS